MKNIKSQMNVSEEKRDAQGNGERGPYTLFSVTHETRTLRRKRIRELFTTQPVLGYLVAEFDFEWTIHRAIVMMSECPASVIKAHFEIQQSSGWFAYQRCWEKCVKNTRNDVVPTLGRVAFGGPAEKDITAEQQGAIKQAIQLRHNLVHGLSGNLPRPKADMGFELLVAATERIVQFTEGRCGKPMFARIHKPLSICTNCQRHCAFKKERERAQALAKEKHEARRQGSGKK